MDQGTQTVASFTGTLLRHEHTLGQKFVQLVFRENDKNVLCVSTDARTVALTVGQIYRVEGTFKHRGEQPFTYNPQIALLKKRWVHFSRTILMCIGIVCLVVIVGAVIMQGSPPAKPIKVTTVQQITPAATHMTVTTTPKLAPALAVTATPPKPTYHVPTVVRHTTTAPTPTPTTSSVIPAPTEAAPIVPSIPTTPDPATAPLSTPDTASGTDTNPAPADDSTAPVTTDPSTPATDPGTSIPTS
jgi:hypothetical protein